jgi:RHS repeat-associated protein
LYNATSPDAGGVNDPIPKAYLTVLFFDERFNFIGEGSATDRVDAPGNGSDRVLVIDPVKAPRNGYAFVYLSNESDEHVYFDNLKVQLRHGHIIEENHYYAYGLRIAGISSRKMGDAREGQLANPYQYQGDYSEFDDETGWNDFALRSYDPQTGRFINADPYDQFASPYVGMGNDPIIMVDPNGGWAAIGLFAGMSQAAILGVTTLGGAIIGGAIDLLSGGDGGTGLLIGASVGFGSNFLSGIGNIGSVAANGTTIAVDSYDGNSTNIDNNNSDTQNEFEEEIRAMFNNGQIIEGLKKIAKHWPNEFTLNNLYQLGYSTEVVGAFATNISSYDLPKSNVRGVYIEANTDEMNKFANCIRTFGYIVRGFYHEMFHVQQILGIGLWQAPMLNEPTMQFTAIYYSLQNKNLPKYDTGEETHYINEALKNYEKMPKEDQDTYRQFKIDLEIRLTELKK